MTALFDVPAPPPAEPVIELGSRVRFTWHLTRRTERTPSDARARYDRVKVWSTEGYPGQPEPEPREGIIVGARTLANGGIYWGSYDEPTTFHPTEHFAAYLVAYDLHRKPVLVLPEHLQPAERAS